MNKVSERLREISPSLSKCSDVGPPVPFRGDNMCVCVGGGGGGLRDVLLLYEI